VGGKKRFEVSRVTVNSTPIIGNNPRPTIGSDQLLHDKKSIGVDISEDVWNENRQLFHSSPFLIF
jgi:hypothetical protein